MTIVRTREELLAEIESLRFRLEEAEETLRAIGSGEVDAFVVSVPDGEQIFTLKGADQPYRVLVENMNEGAATLIADGTIFYCNKRLADLLQVPMERLIGTRLASYVTSAELEMFLALLEKCAREPVIDEISLLTAAGNSVPVLISCGSLDLSGNRVISVVVSNLTDYKHAEESLRASNELLKLIVNTVPVRVFWKDTELRYLGCNQAFACDARVASPDDLIGKDDYQLVWKELAEMYRADDREVIESGVAKLSYDEQQTTVAGDRIWIRTSKVPLRNEASVIFGVLGIYEDITEHKKLEVQLAQAQKMEVVGQLSGGIAHDLNNILTAIIGYSTLMEMGMSEDDPKRDHLNHVLAAAERAAELTKSLLAFSRKQIINPQPVDLNQIIVKTKKFMTRIIAEDIDFTVEFKKDSLVVNADTGQIEQVLMNLVTNARDAMPSGGQLTIETDAVVLDDSFIKAHGFGEPGPYALLIFSDSGEGMDSATCKKVFEPFFTTKEVGKGTGLGLSIVYGIVKQHNGFITVYSESGNGTTFRIYLPLTQTAVESSQKNLAKVLKGGKETILVADDDFSVRDLLEKTLTMFGYTVIVAVDGSDALSKFREQPTGINLVMLDVVMPKLNGKEVRDEIRKLNPAVNVIFMSGYTRDIIHKRGVLDESVQFIPKPLNPKKLLLKVRNVLDGGGDEQE